MTGEFATIFIVALLNFIIGIRVLFRNHRRIVNQAFFLFTTGIAGITSGLVALFLTSNFLFDKVILFRGHTMIVGLILLAFFFPNERPKRKSFLWTLIPAAILYVITPFNLIHKGMNVS